MNNMWNFLKTRVLGGPTSKSGYLPNPKNPDGTTKRVFVGVSGGVDSSVSAALLKDAGFDVTGVFIKVYYPPQLQCNWQDERADAMRVCASLGIPFAELDLEAEYKQGVFDYMIDTYRAGQTPNPDVFCNKYVKFGGFLDWALAQGADYVATGHYAQVAEVGDSKSDFSDEVSNSDVSPERSGGDVGVLETTSTAVDSTSPTLASLRSSEKSDLESSDLSSTPLIQLRMGADQNKDQTYFLYTLTQKQLRHILFPVGHLPKPEVRELAKKYDLFTENKKDSQGLCFVGHVDMREFLKDYIDEQPGDVLNEAGEVMGRHEGSLFYTIGQRHGFEIDPQHKTPDMPRMFVVGKDHDSNTITIGPKASLDALDQATTTVQLRDVTWTGLPVQVGARLQGRIRHRGKLVDCTLKLRSPTSKSDFSVEVSNSDVLPERSGGDVGVLETTSTAVDSTSPTLASLRSTEKSDLESSEFEITSDLESPVVEVVFDQPQNAVAPGQSVVLYDGEVCVGGGIIV